MQHSKPGSRLSCFSFRNVLAGETTFSHTASQTCEGAQEKRGLLLPKHRYLETLAPSIFMEPYCVPAQKKDQVPAFLEVLEGCRRPGTDEETWHYSPHTP